MGSYTEAEGEENLAEVAFVVREDWQGMGVASYLLSNLEEIAEENGYRGFLAHVMLENKAMIHVFKKRYPDAEIAIEEGTAKVVMGFGSAKAP